MTFEDDLLFDLRKGFPSIEIFVEDSSDKYFELLGQSYPTYGSKIDWGEVPNSIEEEADKENYIESCLEFFDKICVKYCLNGNIIFIGDNAIDKAFKMPVDVLRRCLSTFLEIPQHHYIISEDYRWCIVFSMEGYMSFGFKP